MEDYSSSYSSSKSANSYHSHHSMLHSVRKSQAKPWKKAPVAPQPPTPVKVFKVHPLNFRDLVQQFTGAPEFMPQHLRSVAATATSLAVASPSNPLLSNPGITAAASSPLILPPKTPTSSWFRDVEAEELQVKTQEGATAMAPAGLLELNLSSPSAYNWCSFVPPMSPGTMTCLEPGRVL